MTTDENKAVVRRYYDEVLNGRNLQVIQEIAADDYIENDPFPGQGNGRDDLTRRAELLITAFSPTFLIEDIVSEGDRVAVRYLPSDPRVSRLSMEDRPAARWRLWMGGVLLFVPAFGLGLYVWNVLLLRRLLQWGRPVAAFVTRRLYVASRYRGGYYDVRYRFLGPSGNSVDGHSGIKHQPLLRATVTVLYDPQKPSRNALYPFSFSGFESISEETSRPVPEQPVTEHPAIPRVPGFRLDYVSQLTLRDLAQEAHSYTFPVSPDDNQTLEGPSWEQEYVLEAGAPAPGVAAILDFYENAFKERGGMVVYRDEKRRTITLKMPFEDGELWFRADLAGRRSQKISTIIVETGRLRGGP